MTQLDLTWPIIVTMVSALVCFAAVWGSVRSSVKRLNGMPENMAIVRTEVGTIRTDQIKQWTTIEKIRDEQVEHGVLIRELKGRVDND